MNFKILKFLKINNVKTKLCLKSNEHTSNKIKIMDTEEFTLFEKMCHSICRDRMNKKKYEYRLLQITCYKSDTYKLLTQFQSLINHAYFSSWVSTCLYLSNIIKINKNYQFSFRERKEQRLVIRKVIRLAQVNLHVLRICDLLVLRNRLIN